MLLVTAMHEDRAPSPRNGLEPSLARGADGGGAAASGNGTRGNGGGGAHGARELGPERPTFAPAWTLQPRAGEEAQAALEVVTVEAGGWRFAMPAALVVHRAELSRSQGAAVAAEGVYRLAGETLPAVSLAERCSFLPPAGWQPEGAAVLVVEAGGRLALLVDRLLPVDRVSFEPFSGRSSAAPCMGGIGIASSGERSAVLDPWALVRSRRGEEVSNPSPAAAEEEPRAVFIADDSVGTREGLARLAVRLGFQPLTAGDGFEALDVLSRARSTPVLLILDSELPGINADELTSLLRAQGTLRRVPVVLLTSVGADLASLAGRGASASLLRPFRRETAAAVIHLLAGGENENPDDGYHPGG